MDTHDRSAAIARMARRREQIRSAATRFRALPPRRQAELMHGIEQARAEARHIVTYRRPS